MMTEDPRLDEEVMVRSPQPASGSPASPTAGLPKGLGFGIAGIILLLEASRRSLLGAFMATGGCALLYRGVACACGGQVPVRHNRADVAASRSAGSAPGFKRAERSSNEVTYESEESFPASDPPSWTPGRV